MSSRVTGGAFVSQAVATSGANTEEGQALSSSWGGAIAGDTAAYTASSAATRLGNAASIAQGYSLGVLQGRSMDITRLAAPWDGIKEAHGSSS